MRILVLNWRDLEHPRAGGAEVRLHNVYERLVKKGHEVTLLATLFEGASKKSQSNGMRILRMGKDWNFPFLCLLKLPKLIQEFNPDVVVEDLNKLPMLSPWVCKKPLLIQMHHLWGKSIFRESSIIAAFIVWLSEQSIPFLYKKLPFCVVSPSTHDELADLGIPRKNTEVIYNGTDLEFYQPAMVEKENFILWLSRVQKYKGIDTAVAAFQELLKTHPEMKLKIAGDGPYLEAVQKNVAELGLQDSIDFLGFIGKEQKRDLLQRAVCLWQTSYKEGWGLTVTEAGACGCPVIANNAPGLKDSVRVGKNGMLYDFGDTISLVKCTKELLNSTELQKQLQKGGIEWTKQFTWSNAADQTEDLLERVIGIER